ncbi:hypothetical protein WJD76_005125, partial [Klebsiella pneumoniae]
MERKLNAAINEPTKSIDFNKLAPDFSSGAYSWVPSYISGCLMKINISDRKSYPGMTLNAFVKKFFKLFSIYVLLVEMINHSIATFTASPSFTITALCFS